MGAHIHIGTSGWHYPHWRGPFYPPDISSDQMLTFYTEHFRAVELNNSFYQLPEEQTLQAWRDAAPPGFLFTVKASRYITHMKKLKDPEQPVGRFLDRISVLRGRLGPVLFQLPPNWRCNSERLKQFLTALPQDNRYAFEFRDPSWHDDLVYQALEQAGAAFCIYDLAGRQSPKAVTTDFIYVRLHGPGEAYEGSYSSQVLAGWAGAFSAWARQGKDIFCFFDNDQKGFAPANASALQEMLDQSAEA